jgi:hypothetical protein
MIGTHVHVIAGLTICSRIADVWTTYLVTPKLRLEANALAKRLGWKYALLTVLVGLIAYPSPPLGVILMTTSFIVSAFNASKILAARALGEEELAAQGRRIILATPPWPGLLFLMLPGIFIGVLAGILLSFYPSRSQWGFYFGLGMIGYTVAVFFWYPIRYFRIRRQMKEKTNGVA